MGMYDTIIGACPKCQAKFESQTKLGQCAANQIHVGEAFDVRDMRVELKDACSCGARVTAVVKDRMLAALAIGEADGREGLWGDLGTLERSRDEQRTAQMEEIYQMAREPEEP